MSSFLGAASSMNSRGPIGTERCRRVPTSLLTKARLYLRLEVPAERSQSTAGWLGESRNAAVRSHVCDLVGCGAKRDGTAASPRRDVRYNLTAAC